jgi:hypothetical protein
MAEETTAPATTVDGAPLDFEAYEAWHNAGRHETAKTAKTTKDETKPAAADVKTNATKTAPESETDDQQDDETDDEKGEVKPQKKSGFQRRIDGLNRKLGAKDAEIAELRKAQGANAAPPPKEAAKTGAAETEKAGKPEAKNFDTYEEYVEALADWKLDTRENAREAERKQRAAKEAHDAVIQANDAKFRERRALYPDWKEKVDAATDIPITEIMHTLITESEYRADLGYYLAENPEEASRIAALSPLRQAAELGKLESTFAEDDTKDAVKKTAEAVPVKRVSKAPAPVKTVRAQAEASEPDPADYAAWEKWRNAQPGASVTKR